MMKLKYSKLIKSFSIKSFKKIYRSEWSLLTLLILAALILRLSLVNVFYHIDMLSNAHWGMWIYENGTKGFYDNSIWIYSWPTQPPLINLVLAVAYWLYLTSLELFRNIAHAISAYRLAPTYMIWFFDFVKWYNDEKYPESFLKLGHLISLKFIEVLADLLIGLSIYLSFRKINPRRALLITAIFLLSPFGIYVSAIWGQTDGLSFLFLLLTVLALINKKLFLAPFLFMISAGLKPTSLIFVPLFLWIYLRQKGPVLSYISGILFAFGGFLATVAVFTDRNLYYFITHDLVTKVFLKAGLRVSTNSFNYWHIFIGNEPVEHFVKFLFLPSYYWGWLFFILVNVIAFYVSRDKSQKNILTAFAIIGLGTWLFMINMLDRYFYAGIVFMLMSVFYYPKMMKAWIVLSLIFWLNLYHGFWVPRQWDLLRQILIGYNHLVTRVLSLISVLIFFLYLKNTGQIIFDPFKKFIKSRMK